MTLINTVLKHDQYPVHFQIETPTCSNDLTDYAEQLDSARYAFARRRRDVADDVRESRPRRAVEGFTTDGMEVSIQIGSHKPQVNSSTTEGNIMVDLNGLL